MVDLLNLAQHSMEKKQESFMFALATKMRSLKLYDSPLQQMSLALHSRTLLELYLSHPKQIQQKRNPSEFQFQWTVQKKPSLFRVRELTCPALRRALLC